jgi:hypothetical protein
VRIVDLVAEVQIVQFYVNPEPFPGMMMTIIALLATLFLFLFFASCFYILNDEPNCEQTLAVDAEVSFR